MAPPVLVNSLWLNFLDVDLHQSAGMWTLQDQTPLNISPYADLIAKSQALSCMGLFGQMKQVSRFATATPELGPYCTYRDQVVFPVRSANTAMDLVIPGPVAGIFSTGGELVNMEDTAVQEWWTAVQAILGDELGAPWTQISRGYRRFVPTGRQA